MSIKQITDAYIEGRLSEWGEWFSRGGIIDIGFPRRNIIARARDEGGQLIRAVGQKPLPSHSSAEEMEAIIMLLNHYQPIPAHVLMITYLYPDAPILVAEKRFGYKKSNYHKQLNLALAWIKGYFIAQTRIKKYNKMTLIKFKKNALQTVRTNLT